MKKIWTLFAFLCSNLYLYAQIPSGYYNNATGTGFILKTQLYNIIKGHTNNGYAALWTTYATSDRDNQYENDNTILDLYSENPTGPDSITFIYGSDQCGSYNVQGDCYNREHIIPQSVFNSNTPMVSDAHFIIPVDGYVNNERANYPHGNVSTVSWTSLNGSKLGASAILGYVGTVFEPIDEFKGDIARMYFYFATRYENVVSNYTSYPMFNGSSDTVFKTAFLNMLINWHHQDPVSAREITRNNAIYLKQNNRNPFIDHPEYVDFIWNNTSSPTNQTITFNSLPNVMIGSPNFLLNATASSGLPVSYSSSDTNVVKISGNLVSIIGLGTTTITATQNGNANYTAANPVNQNLTVINSVIAAWDFNALTGGLGNFGISPYPSSYTASNVMVSGLIRGAGIGTPTNSTSAARAWGGTVNTASASSASNTNTSISIVLQANSDYAMSITSINPFDYRRSNTGATQGLLQYSIDGSPYDSIAAVSFTSSASSGASIGIIDLSSIAALQNIHASKQIQIRLLLFGGTGGTFYLYDKSVSTAFDFGITGTLFPCSPSNTFTSESILQNATPYIWYGQSLTTSGTYTTTLINSQGCDSILTLDLTVLPNNATLNLKAYLQGYFLSNASMNTVLYNQNQSANTLLCDTIQVELHNDYSPYNIAYSTQGILQTNGLVLLNLPSSVIGNTFYVAIKHRNSIETWSFFPVNFTANSDYDFTNSATKAYGANQIETDIGQWALYTGDINQDGAIDIFDFLEWDNDNQNFYSGYFATDLNGDASIDIFDFLIWDPNNQNFIGITIP
ncbi:MAG: endonuclease [Chitinophagaceae bacterium]